MNGKMTLEEWRNWQYNLTNKAKRADFLEKENKRYREVLQEIKNKAKDDYFKTDIYILADEALEEQS